MTASTISIQVAPRQINPRRAGALGEIAVRAFLAAGGVCLKAAQRNNATRAARELRRLAAGYQINNPELAADLRAAAQHAESAAITVC